jgi:hypothetical protein
LQCRPRVVDSDSLTPLNWRKAKADLLHGIAFAGDQRIYSGDYARGRQRVHHIVAPQADV